MISERGHSSKSCCIGAIGVAIALTHVGCGSSASSGSDLGAGSSGRGDGGPVATVDGGGTGAGAEGGATAPEDAASDANGAPSTTYPAFPVDVGQVVDVGGPVLSAPVIVTVTWSADPDAARWNALGDAIGATTYWKDITSEYGIGASTSGAANHVSITTAPPASFADTDLDALVEASAGAGWPAATANTIYALYLPPNTTITSGGDDLCAAGVGGYHDETKNKNLVYAIMPHCSGFQTADIELGASHELNEAATDPHPETKMAYAGFDANHLAFELFNQFQDELGDACESFVEANDTTDFTPYTVQRQWSNRSAAAGSHWCLPPLAEPFYNTTFLPSSNLDTISVDLSTVGFGTGKTQSKGFKVALKSSRTFPIGFFSDGPTDVFTIDVQGLGAGNPIGQDQNGNLIANGDATVTIDKTSGKNGEIANVTVTPTAYSSLGITFFYVRARLAGALQEHYLPVIVSQN